MTVASLPEILRCRRCPKISAILWAVSRHSPSSQLRSNSLWMGKFFLEDEVTAVFDLRDRIEAREIDLLSLLGRELRPQDQGPIVKPLADDRGAQFVGGPCRAPTSSTARNALSFLRKVIFLRLSSCSMKLWPLR